MKLHVYEFYHRVDTPEQINRICKTFLNELSQGFKNLEQNELITQCTILDPRFKKYGFANQLKYEAAYNILKVEVCNITTYNENVETKSELPLNSSAATKSSLLWQHFDEKDSQIRAPENQTATGIIELSEPLLQRDRDPLIW